MELREKVDQYLKERFGPGTGLEDMELLGKGVHGAGFLLTFRTPEGEKRLIMKTLFPSRFGHDHYADRAQVLLLANANYNQMPKHVRAVDVVGESPGGLISLGDASEFYIFMEEAQGESYFQTLNAVLERGYLEQYDKDRVEMLALFLADIHGRKYPAGDAPVLYRRRIRDLIGHGECIMGIIDAFEASEFVSDRELVEYAGRCMPWWGKIRNRSERLCSVHGDYHPGNIRIRGEDFILLDRSRGSWGEPADDVSCLSVNFIHYALKDRGGFEGPFAELFRLFVTAYMDKTGDQALFEVIQPFYAFRVLVIANPGFYPENSVQTKRVLLDFGRAVLEEERFDVDSIPRYLRRK
jgi:hypothetical protein